MPRLPGAKERKESMTRLKLIGFLAALLVLACFSVALVVHPDLKMIAYALTVLSFAAGTVTVTYATPVAGTSAPTAAQVYGLGLITAQVNCADTDTVIVITHNFGLNAQELLDLFPFAIVNNIAGATTYPQYTFTTATNTLTIGKASTSGTGGTFDVCVWRPPTNQIGVNRGIPSGAS